MCGAFVFCLRLSSYGLRYHELCVYFLLEFKI